VSFSLPRCESLSSKASRHRWELFFMALPSVDSDSHLAKPPFRCQSEQVRAKSIPWSQVTGSRRCVSPPSPGRRVGGRWQRGKRPQRLSRAPGHASAPILSLSNEPKSEGGERVGMIGGWGGGVNAFTAAASHHLKIAGGFDDRGPDKVRLPIHRQWLTEDRGGARLWII